MITVDKAFELYDTFYLDAFGVLVHLDGAIPGAYEFIHRLNDAGKNWLVLSNGASKTLEDSAKSYQARGLPIQAERVLTSGSLLASTIGEAGFGPDDVFLVIGRQGSRCLVEAAGVQVCEWQESSKYGDQIKGIVIADQAEYDLLPMMNSLFSFLCDRIDKGQAPWLLLPNPDLIYPTAAGYGFTAGALATMVETGLQVRYGNQAPTFEKLGKPHSPIFMAAKKRYGFDRAVMVGDQTKTDIRGANSVGLDSILMGTGVARIDEPGTWGTDLPTWVLPSF